MKTKNLFFLLILFLLLSSASPLQADNRYTSDYVVVGDSVFSSFDGRIVSQRDDSWHRPNALTSNNTISLFYDKLPGTKADYYRADSDQIVRSGTWQTSTMPIFGMDAFSLLAKNGDSFVFTPSKPIVRLAYWRTSLKGQIAITIPCGRGQTVPGMCVEHKSVDTQSHEQIEYTEYEFEVIPDEDIRILVTGSAHIWGVINLSYGDMTATNLARGGHNFDELYTYAYADIGARLGKYKTFIIQAPLMNMINDGQSIAYAIESTRRYLSLLTNENTIVVIPYYRAKYMQGDRPILLETGYTAEDIYNAVEETAIDLGFKTIDFRDSVSDFARHRGVTIQEALSGSGRDGGTITADGSHPNNAGSVYLAERLIDGIFENQFLPGVYYDP